MQDTIVESKCELCGLYEATTYDRVRDWRNWTLVDIFLELDKDELERRINRDIVHYKPYNYKYINATGYLSVARVAIANLYYPNKLCKRCNSSLANVLLNYIKKHDRVDIDILMNEFLAKRLKTLAKNKQKATK